MWKLTEHYLVHLQDKHSHDPEKGKVHLQYHPGALLHRGGHEAVQVTVQTNQTNQIETEKHKIHCEGLFF